MKKKIQLTIQTGSALSNELSSQKPSKSPGKKSSTPKMLSPNKPKITSDGNMGTNMQTYDEEMIATSKRNEDLVEVRTFLPTIAEKMISGRYESPLKSLKSSTGRWKVFTLMLAIFSFCYFALHLWLTISLANYGSLPDSPRAIIQVSNFLIKENDMLFYNYTMNIIMDCWALVIYLCLIVILLRQSSNKLDTSNEETGFERVLSKMTTYFVVLFALSYILGTALVLTHSDLEASDLSGLIIFHLSKMIYLILNVIAFKKYKSKKFIYEDLLIEALGPSDGGDKSQSELENEDIEPKTFPIDVQYD